jgi:hypothetical protein
MQALNGVLMLFQGGTWWGSAGILVVVLVICCLGMMFMMGRMGGGSKNRSDMDRKNDADKDETKNKEM